MCLFSLPSALSPKPQCKVDRGMLSCGPQLTIGAMEGEIFLWVISTACTVQLSLPYLDHPSWSPKTGRNKSSGVNLYTCFCFPTGKVQVGLCCWVHCCIRHRGIWESAFEGVGKVALKGEVLSLLLVVLFFRKKELLFSMGLNINSIGM